MADCRLYILVLLFCDIGDFIQEEMVEAVKIVTGEVIYLLFFL